jgi:hypothetical protein
MEWLSVIVVFGVIIGIVGIRAYISTRAEADRKAREARQRGEQPPR